MFRETWQMFCCVEFSSPCFKNTNTAWGLREKGIKNGNGEGGKVDVPAHVGISLPALYRKSYLCIPRNETVRPRSHFLHSCICKRFIYSQDRSGYLAAAK
jgi:hypothetical protein